MNLQQTYTSLVGAHTHIRHDYDGFLTDFIHYVNLGAFYNLQDSNIPQLALQLDSSNIQNHFKEKEKEILSLYDNKVFLNNIYLFEVNYVFLSDLLEKTSIQVKDVIETLEKEIEKG